jgi:hypothetical protein
MKPHYLFAFSLVTTAALAAPVWSGEVVGSTTYEGETVTVRDNGDGTRTVTRIKDGKQTSERVGVAPPPGKIVLRTITFKDQVAFVIAPPPIKSDALAWAKVDGKYLTVIDNHDDTHTVRTFSGRSDTAIVTTRPGPGISIDDGNGGFKPYTPPPKSPVLGSTTYEGQKTTVTDYGGGALGITYERAREAPPMREPVHRH